MKRIKLRTGVAGLNYSYKPGQVVEFDDATAERLVERGMATYETGTELQALASVQASPAPGATDTPLSQMRKPELVQLAADLGIAKPGNLTVPKLIEEIQKKRGEE